MQKKNKTKNKTTTLKWLVTVPLFLVICQCGALLVLEKLNIFKNVKKKNTQQFFHIKSRFYLLSCYDMLFIYLFLFAIIKA